MNKTIYVTNDQDTITLFGQQFAVEKDTLKKSGKYELKAFGGIYTITTKTENKQKVTKSKQNITKT